MHAGGREFESHRLHKINMSNEEKKKILNLEKELVYWKERYLRDIEAMELQYKRLTSMYNILRREVDEKHAAEGKLSIRCKNCGALTSGWCNSCGKSTL